MGHEPVSHPLVIGVGNRDRGDDAIGPLVVDAVRHRWGDDVDTLVAEGDLADLATRWHRNQDVLIVDAAKGGRAPGETVEIDALVEHLPVDSTLFSSHGAGVGEAIELGRLLGRLPRRLTVIAVEIERTGPFEDLSPAVAAALPVIVERVRALLIRP